MRTHPLTIRTRYRQRQREAWHRQRTMRPAIRLQTPSSGYLPTVDSHPVLWENTRMAIRDKFGRYVAI